MTISLKSGDLRLEAVLRPGEGDLGALVLHPHPQYGGEMDNHVVVGIAEALASLGATTLRFNFRGVGESEGRYDGGKGEADDARAAVAALREQAPGKRLVLSGYSFGAMIAAAIAGEAEPAGLILVSPPVSAGALPRLDPKVPTLLITGDVDAVAPAAAVKALAGGLVSAVVVDGADHGWWPGVDSLVDEVDRFAKSLLPVG
jgi:uncharacterized protein